MCSFADILLFLRSVHVFKDDMYLRSYLLYTYLD